MTTDVTAPLSAITDVLPAVGAIGMSVLLVVVGFRTWGWLRAPISDYDAAMLEDGGDLTGDDRSCDCGMPACVLVFEEPMCEECADGHLCRKCGDAYVEDVERPLCSSCGFGYDDKGDSVWSDEGEE